MKLAAALLACSAGLFALPFTNGSFEQPGGAPIRTLLADGSTLVTGWTNQGGGQVYESSNQDGIVAAAGDYYVSFGHSGAIGGTFTQSFDTVSGASYSVDYVLSLQQGTGAVFFLAEVLDGATLLDSEVNTVNAINWVSGTQLQFTALSGTTTLRFTDIGGPDHFGTNTALDAVEVNSLEGSTVPEPSSFLLAASAVFAFTRLRRVRS